MRLLFTLDKKDYGACTRSFVRSSSRSIIIRGGRIAMVRSLKYDYYNFPGGGIEPGESRLDAVIRETLEEAGLRVIPGSIREYGYVHRIQKSPVDETECFVQDNFYYFCEAEDGPEAQDLEDYEAEEGFTPVFIEPEAAIFSNRCRDRDPQKQVGIEREARVLELLLSEGYFG